MTRTEKEIRRSLAHFVYQFATSVTAERQPASTAFIGSRAVLACTRPAMAKSTVEAGSEQHNYTCRPTV